MALPPFRAARICCHLVCGVAAGAVIVVMSVTATGLTLSLRRLVQWRRRRRAVPAAEAQAA